MDVDGGENSNVFSLSVIDLILKLCKSILLHTVRSERIDGGFLSFLDRRRPFHQPWVEQQALCRKLCRQSLDVLLLRQWEWLSQEEQGTGSPCFHAMVHVLHLQQQRQQEAASRLMNTLDSLLHSQLGLSEAGSVLHFLHLLSHKSGKTVARQKPEDWIYDIFSRSDLWWSRVGPPCWSTSGELHGT